MAKRTTSLLPWLLLAIVLLAGWAFWPQQQTSPAAVPAGGAHAVPDASPPLALPDTQPDATPPPRGTPAIANGFLPPEARDTIALIQRGGPFPHRQDGGIFGNREGLLPRKPRGWYREYTVETPGLRHRGARRIVTGGDPPGEWYYTDDHYDSFRAFEPGAPDGALR